MYSRILLYRFSYSINSDSVNLLACDSFAFLYDNVLIVNNNKKYLDSVYGAVMMAKAISRFHLVRLMHARWPPTVIPSQLTSAESPLVGCCHPHHHCHLLLLLSPNDGAHLTISRRVEGKVNLGTA